MKLGTNEREGLTLEKLQKTTKTPGKIAITPEVTLSPFLKPSKHKSKLRSIHKDTDVPKFKETEAPESITSKFMEKMGYR